MIGRAIILTAFIVAQATLTVMLFLGMCAAITRFLWE